MTLLTVSQAFSPCIVHLYGGTSVVSECFALYVGYNRRQGVSEAVARNERQHLDSKILVL